MPTNLQNFKQKDLAEVKIFQGVLGGRGATFLVQCRVVNVWVDKQRSAVLCALLVIAVNWAVQSTVITQSRHGNDVFSSSSSSSSVLSPIQCHATKPHTAAGNVAVAVAD